MVRILEQAIFNDYLSSVSNVGAMVNHATNVVPVSNVGVVVQRVIALVLEGVVLSEERAQHNLIRPIASVFFVVSLHCVAVDLLVFSTVEQQKSSAVNFQGEVKIKRKNSEKVNRSSIVSANSGVKNQLI